MDDQQNPSINNNPVTPTPVMPPASFPQPPQENVTPFSPPAPESSPAPVMPAVPTFPEPVTPPPVIPEPVTTPTFNTFVPEPAPVMPEPIVPTPTPVEPSPVINPVPVSVPADTPAAVPVAPPPAAVSEPALGDTEGKGAGKYKVRVIASKCIGAASCVAVAPKAFRLNDQQIAEILPTIGEESDENLLLAAQSCPTLAIEVIDTETGEKVWPK